MKKERYYFERLKGLRLNSNITIQQVAKELNVSPSIVRDWENSNGKSEPNNDQLLKLKKLYNTTLDYIFENSDIPYCYDSDSLFVKYLRLSPEKRNIFHQKMDEIERLFSDPQPSNIVSIEAAK